MKVGAVEKVPVHAADCDRSASCGCVGLVVEMIGRSESMVALRLAYEDETAGRVTLLAMGDVLLMLAGASYRVSITVDWGAYHRMVMETLLRESVRVADARGMALATSAEWPGQLLAEFGFSAVGGLMRREARGIS